MNNCKSSPSQRDRPVNVDAGLDDAGLPVYIRETLQRETLDSLTPTQAVQGKKTSLYPVAVFSASRRSSIGTPLRG